LVSAKARSNFKLVVNSTVERVVRKGGVVTGVDVIPFGEGGFNGTINVKQKTGKVILAAGAFGTTKILFRSGIGPADQLQVVKTAEADKMAPEKDWINLPVG
jgi:cellobiose dehydrogenase (acceptor)